MNEARWGQASLGVGSLGSSEEKDVRFWSMKLVVTPASGLLNSQSSPFLGIIGNYVFCEETASGYFLVDIFRQDDMAELVVVVHVLVRIFDFVGVVWHLNNNDYDFYF